MIARCDGRADDLFTMKFGPARTVVATLSLTLDDIRRAVVVARREVSSNASIGRYYARCKYGDGGPGLWARPAREYVGIKR